MTYCVHCGLTPATGCSDHVQYVPQRKKVAARVERDPRMEQSIHPRVRNGRTVHTKCNTAKPKRAA